MQISKFLSTKVKKRFIPLFVFAGNYAYAGKACFTDLIKDKEIRQNTNKALDEICTLLLTHDKNNTDVIPCFDHLKQTLLNQTYSEVNIHFLFDYLYFLYPSYRNFPEAQEILLTTIEELFKKYHHLSAVKKRMAELYRVLGFIYFFEEKGECYLKKSFNLSHDLEVFFALGTYYFVHEKEESAQKIFTVLANNSEENLNKYLVPLYFARVIHNYYIDLKEKGKGHPEVLSKYTELLDLIKQETPNDQKYINYFEEEFQRQQKKMKFILLRKA